MSRSAGWMGSGRLVVETMRTRGYGGKPHRVMPLGVDVEQFRPDAAARETMRTRLGWTSPNPPVAGYVGRFVEEKGVGLMMRALDRGLPIVDRGEPLPVETRSASSKARAGIKTASARPQSALGNLAPEEFARLNGRYRSHQNLDDTDL